MEIKPGRREKMLNNGTRKMWKRKHQVYNKKSETSKNQRLGRVIQEGKMTNKETRKTQQGKYGKEASKWEKKDNKNKTERLRRDANEITEEKQD